MRVGILLTGAALLIAACDPVTVPERNGTEVFDFRLPLGADSAVMRWPAASRIAVYVNPAPQAERITNSSSRGSIGRSTITVGAAAGAAPAAGAAAAAGAAR